jgi:hypothetical protein
MFDLVAGFNASVYVYYADEFTQVSLLDFKHTCNGFALHVGRSRLPPSKDLNVAKPAPAVGLKPVFTVD